MTSPPPETSPATSPSSAVRWTSSSADPHVAPGRARHLSLGDRGERYVRRELVSRGLVELDRNWRCAGGELDLVMLDGSIVVAVEVKTRRGVGRGHPLEAVDDAKLTRLHALVWRWLSEHGIRATGVRVDVAGVVWPRQGRPTLTYARGVA